MHRTLMAWAKALRSGGARAQDWAEHVEAQASVHGPHQVGAYRELLPVKPSGRWVDEALVAGRDLGPLAGIPCSVKDLYGVPGTRTFAGTQEALPARFEKPGWLVQSLLSQGALLTGKTHTVAFAFGGIGANVTWGTPENPAAPGRVPGGSSSGAGVSLCEGSARLAFGTDTAGSVRIPAAWTGNLGLKTTKRRWSTDGIVPLSTTLDTPGVLATCAADLAYAFCALEGVSDFDGRYRRLEERRSWKVGDVPSSMMESASPGVLEALDGARRKLERAGIWVLSKDQLGGVQEAKAVFDVGGPTAIELAQFLSAQLPRWIEPLEAMVKDRMSAAAEVPAVEYLRRLQVLASAHESAMASFEDSGVDAFVSVSVANSPPRRDEIADLSAYRTQNLLALRNTGYISMLGLCAVSLPCGRDSVGAPVGLQLIGRAYDEPRLLAMAQHAESVLAHA